MLHLRRRRDKEEKKEGEKKGEERTREKEGERGEGRKMEKRDNVSTCVDSLETKAQDRGTGVGETDRR
jgi:hypothetical protein